METKKKFIMEFDEKPAFVYVCEKPGVEHLLINGETPNAWTSLEVKTSVDEMPSYTLDAFITEE